MNFPSISTITVSNGEYFSQVIFRRFETSVVFIFLVENSMEHDDLMWHWQAPQRVDYG